MNEVQKAERLSMIKRAWQEWNSAQHMRRLMDGGYHHNDPLYHAQVSVNVKDEQQVPDETP